MAAGHPEVGGDQRAAGHSSGRSEDHGGPTNIKKINHEDISERKVMCLRESALSWPTQQKPRSVCGATQ